MFKREMKVNFKSFLIWLLILIALFLVVFVIYPSIINGENAQMMEEMMKAKIEELKKQSKVFRRRFTMLVEAQLDLIKNEDWDHLMDFENDASDKLLDEEA